MNILSKEKNDIAHSFKIHENDCGSSFVQCALLTSQILKLTDHLKIHKHDFSSRRSLLIMVNKRKKLLKYVYNKNHQSYYALIEKLQIRDILKTKN